MERIGEEEGQLATLKAARNAIARQIDRLESSQTANEAQGRDMAMLTKELSRLMEEIRELSPADHRDEVDELTKKREARIAVRGTDASAK